LKLNDTHQLIFNADEVSAHTIKENAEALLVSSKEVGLEVNADRSAWSCLEIRIQDEVTI
jgi:hypothetical protein